MASLVSALRWENTFFTFLRTELAPSATRWRDALRLTLLCAVATTFIIGCHVPYGEFLVIYFFAVSQPDAWASLRKARLRGLGTLIGGGLGIVGVVACGDKPGLALCFQTFLFFAGLFLYRTTTLPYAVLFAMFTYAIVIPVAATDPDASLEKIFWRILLTTAGAVIGTLVQVLLWPENPEKLLLRQLAERLESAELILSRTANRAGLPDQSPTFNADASITAAMAGQLDLLASIEAGSAWLRQRHTEQIKLITDVEMILVLATQIERMTIENHPLLQTDSVRARLLEIGRQLTQIRQALTTGNVSSSSPAPVASIDDESVSALSAITGLERISAQMPVSLAFLTAARTHWLQEKHMLEPAREPIVERTFFTPACRLSNSEVIRFALKGTLAATICYLIYQSLNWPGISTSVVTCLLCAQSSLGAGLKKSLLRLIGATLGGIICIVVAVAILPGLPGATSFIVLTSVLFFIASWITVGSSRLAYVGIQTGLVFSLVLLNQPGQSIDLGLAGDRILGVLLGITVMGFIDLLLWPNFAGTALRGKLAEANRTLAAIPRHAARSDWAEVDDTALAVHGQIAAALALYNEEEFEFGVHTAKRRMHRQRSLAFIHAMESVFLALLVVLRHRRSVNYERLPPRWQQTLQTFDEALAQSFEAKTGSSAENVTKESGSVLSELIEQIQLQAIIEPDETTRQFLLEYTADCNELVKDLRHFTTQCRYLDTNVINPIIKV
jgi:multidrug resistance protein MdtO